MGFVSWLSGVAGTLVVVVILACVFFACCCSGSTDTGPSSTTGASSSSTSTSVKPRSLDLGSPPPRDMEEYFDRTTGRGRETYD